MKELLIEFVILGMVFVLGITVGGSTQMKISEKKITELEETVRSLRASASRRNSLPEVAWSQDQHTPSSAPAQPE